MKRFQKYMIGFLLILIVSLIVVPITTYADEIPALSKSGAMKLTDDITIGDKHIITVTTRDEHYFYIIIDRGSENENTVHFLNPVDTIDLYAILNETTNEIDTEECICMKRCKTGNINTECYTCLFTMSECLGTESVQKETVDSKFITGIILIVVPSLILIIWYGADFKKKSRKNQDNDEYDFDEYENYIEDEKME